MTLFGVVNANVSANTSRVGFRGIEDLGDGLKAGFWLEAGFSPATGSLSYGARFVNRRSTVSLLGGCVTLEVANDGPPIAAERQARIFDRAFRADESRAGSAACSGLGLAIVEPIMDLHDGTVSVISGAGRSTVFRRWFPGAEKTGPRLTEPW